MTANIAEIRDKLSAFIVEVGAKDVTLFIRPSSSNYPSWLSVEMIQLPKQPGESYGKKININAHGSTLEEMFVDAISQWHEKKSDLNEMFVEIIANNLLRHCDENGNCEPSVLKLKADIDESHLALWGAAAIELANAKAACAPFSIRVAEKSNNAPPEEPPPPTEDEVVQLHTPAEQA